MFGFGKEFDFGNAHSLIHGFAHVVNGEGGDADGGESFHFDAGLGGDFGGGSHDDTIAGFGDVEIDFAMGQRQRMAERDKLAGLLGGENAGEPRGSENVAFG